MANEGNLLSKTLVIGIIILFLITAVGPSTANMLNKDILVNEKSPLLPLKSGNIIYVDDDNTEGPWDGTGENPYKNISDALNKAIDGDTVFVFSGTYYEGIRIRNQINLIGEDKNTTIIEAEKRHNAIILFDHYIKISGFTINNTDDWANDCGIEIQNAWGTHTTHNTITGNIFKNHRTEAITVYQSNYNTITDNLIIKSGGISFGSIENYNNIVSNNTFIGSGISIWGSPSYNLVSGNHITNGGITIKQGSNNEVSNNVIENGKDIIITTDTTNNVVENNVLISSGTISLGGSTNSNVRFNTFIDSKGITISGKKLNHWISHTIHDNTINDKPIYYFTSEKDLYVPYYTGQLILVDCSNCIVKNLHISNVDYGIQIGFSTGNTIALNNITNTKTGIRIVGNSHNNTIYRNNFINNARNAYDECKNNWDNGYQFYGNYWDDYKGMDNDGDGIGDTPYNIPGGDNKDRYPLMEPYGMTKLAINLRSGLFRFSGDIENIGDKTAFNIQWGIKFSDVFILLGRNTGIKPEPLLPGKDTTISSGIILGFGQTVITLNVWADNAPMISVSKTGFLFLFLILIK